MRSRSPGCARLFSSSDRSFFLFFFLELTEGVRVRSFGSFFGCGYLKASREPLFFFSSLARATVEKKSSDAVFVEKKV